ncbi:MULTISPECIES: hypothetical protein [Flavobacterium]|uniref:hypothetical protein n=1 Tax=Flavobacterium TaxID=237 RepID=UPI001183875A|nr:MULTISPECIES: hypothetical protein [Flavobacterium]MCR4030441.1 hypothetical protein [Flavobacterium panacis]
MENNIEEKIKNLTNQLLELVSLKCRNDVSNNLVFILSNISETDIAGENALVDRHNRNIVNKKKTPKSFNEAVSDLSKIYDSVYDINLHVYKAEKNRTILDIRYFLKSELDTEYLKTVIDNPPMLHCKIALPPYLKENSKFDVNWELGGIRHHWNLFWYRRKFRKFVQARHSR